jgi:hypothetical protein
MHQQLRAAQALRSLVAGAMRAVGDELRHAEMAAALCAHFGGTPALKVPSALLRAPLTGDAALERVASEAWLDGCIGEGMAAVLAADEAEHAVEPQLARTQRIIAQDEARHAALAWQTLAHCVKRKPTLLPLLRQSTPDLLPPSVRVGSAARRERIAARHIRTAQARLAQMA